MSPTERSFYDRLLSMTLRDHPHQVDAGWVSEVMLHLSSLDLRQVISELGECGKAFDSFLAGGEFVTPRHATGALFGRLVQSQPRWGPDESEVVKYLRQVCYLLYKLELPYSREQEQSVLDRFLRNEEELRSFSGDWEHLALGRSWIRRVFQDFNPWDIRPRNGPGDVSTGERLDDKWRFRRVYAGIEQCYPFHSYFMGGGSVPEIEYRMRPYADLLFPERGWTKSVFVPKDARGPRLIGAEPLEYQYIEQGLGRAVVDWTESHRLTAGHINFRDQQINRDLATLGSKTGEWATLDLRDASDRVSLKLVQYLWQDLPEMLDCLMAARSVGTLLPRGVGAIEFAKYAPMGSALCFPVLALTVAAALVSALRHDVNKPVPFFVYGDDVIVRTVDVEKAVQGLESAGLMVNTGKSCFKGNFRESCGMDAYFGRDVTPVRAKALWTRDLDDARCYEHYVELANHLGRKAWLFAANLLWQELEAVYGFIPFGLPTSPFPCRHVSPVHEAETLNFIVKGLRRRWHEEYQRPQWRVRVIKNARKSSKLGGWERLHRSLLMGGGEEFDPSFVEIRHSTSIKWRWRSV